MRLLVVEVVVSRPRRSHPRREPATPFGEPTRPGDAESRVIAAAHTRARPSVDSLLLRELFAWAPLLTGVPEAISAPRWGRRSVSAELDRARYV